MSIYLQVYVSMIDLNRGRFEFTESYAACARLTFSSEARWTSSESQAICDNIPRVVCGGFIRLGGIDIGVGVRAMYKDAI